MQGCKRYRIKDTATGKYLAAGGGFSGKRRARIFTHKEARLIADHDGGLVELEPL